MKVFAAPFKGEAPKVAVAFTVEMDASRFDFVNKNGSWTELVDVVSSATNASGKSFGGDRHRVTLALTPETYQRVKTGGLRVVSQLDLPPGRYQLRFAAGNSEGQAGSVLYDLEVPDFTKAPLALSGVALTSRQTANNMGTVRPKNPLGDYLPGPPVATREFHQGDTITLFAEIYENLGGGQTHQVAITSQLRSDEGRVITQSSEQRSSTELQGKSGGYGFSSELPLAGIAPGLYVIHVEAQAQYDGIQTASRDVQIRVVP
jgi:hypothetical protein